MKNLRLHTARRGRGLLAALIGTACIAALAASAGGTRHNDASPSAFVPAKLLATARANPSNTFRVILQGSARTSEAQVVSAVRGHGARVDRKLSVISGAS